MTTAGVYEKVVGLEPTLASSPSSDTDLIVDESIGGGLASGSTLGAGTSANDIRFGARNDNSGPFFGKIAEVWMRFDALMPAHYQAESRNQNNPDTFFDLGVVSDLGGGSTVAVGLAPESNAALAITTAKQVALGAATAGNTAGAITAVKSSPVGVAQASDTALPIATDLAANLGLAQESNTAFMVDVAKLSSLGFAVEADTAPAVAASKQSPLGQAQSSDTALEIGRAHV